MLNYQGKSYVCHMDLAMEMIKGKWKSVIICHLSEKAIRFLELQRITNGVSQKVLKQKLDEMEKDGLIIKTVYPEVPPRVEYSLTELGKSLYEAIHPLELWAMENLETD